MTPKEKAKKLVDKFSYNCRECDNSKQSALDAVDEILDAIKIMSFGIRYLSARDYFQEVKEEIENL